MSKSIKIGLYLSNQQHLGADMVAALEEQYAMLRQAREHGWDSLFSGQHFLNEGDNKQLEIVPFLARLMAEAGNMSVGFGVFLLPLHAPVYVAETVAALDVISRGNFVFGIGLGYREVEFHAFGLERRSRVRRFESSLDLIKRLWAGETVTHDSDLGRLDGVTLNIRPVQKPHPPIWIAGSNNNAVRRAARLGDTWFASPLETLEALRGLSAVYREELKSLPKPFPQDVPIFREICVARDRQTALEMAGPALLGKYGAYARWGAPHGEVEEDIETLARDRFILGSPEECHQQLRPYVEELGFNHLVLRPHWPGMPLSSALSSMRLITNELLPLLKGG